MFAGGWTRSVFPFPASFCSSQPDLGQRKRIFHRRNGKTTRARRDHDRSKSNDTTGKSSLDGNGTLEENVSFFRSLSLSFARAVSLSLSLSPIPPLDQPVRFLLSFALNENIDFRASGIIFIEIRFIGLAKSFFL